MSVNLSQSHSSFTNEQIDSIIDNLPKELLEAMKEQNIVRTKVEEVKKPLSRAIYDAKKKELIKQLRTQLNFRMPQSLKVSKDDTIKKDILFYRKAYEEEAANINKIINSTNILNNQLLEPLLTIKETLKNYIEDYKNNLKSVGNPYHEKEEGIDKVNIINNTKEEKDLFQENVKQVNEEMNIYQEHSIKFIQEYNVMNEEISNEIKAFIDSFKKLTDSVTNLRKEVTDGFSVFENSSPQFEDLNNTEKIKNAMSLIMKPLNTITQLISESEEQLTKVQDKEKEPKQNMGLAKKMLNTCEELKQKAKIISEKINIARVKVNLNTIKVKEIEIKAPDIENIEENISQIKAKINETKEKNSQIQEEVMKKTEEFINQSRLDILFIIDSTNSINTYLDDIKKNFNKMIYQIYENCPTSTIFSGFIGYSDFSEIDFGEEYIDIDFTKNKDDINEKIKELKSHGGGDEAEDLCGAFDLALKKTWKGYSRFAIVATDAPCHGSEYHSSEIEDNFPEGDPNKRDIKEFVRQFAEKNISLFCAEFNETTMKMFNIFENEYKKGKQKDSDCEFTVQRCEDLCEIIIQKASNIYKNKKTSEESIK